MKRSPDGLGPIVALDRRLATPLHRQLYAGYRDFARRLRRMRSIYADRRAALEAALVRALGPTARLVGDRAGMHLVLELPRTDDRAIAVRAAAAGLSLTPLSSCFLRRPTRRGLVLGYGTTPVREIDAAVRRLAAQLAP